MPAAAPQSTGLAADPAKVLAGTPTVGAITMLPGETYQGPGPITVGYLGAKKQLVLPTGAWVLLSVADRQSGHATPVPLVSMVFGQFREGQLVSLMAYLFNGRTAPVRGWTEVDECHAEKVPAGSARAVVAQRSAKACGFSLRHKALPKVADAAWEQAPRVAAQLGAAWPTTPVLWTRGWATDASGNYLGFRRADFDGAATTAAAATAPALQEARAAWLRDYLPWMLEGLAKGIGASELEPNDKRTPRLRLTLPD